VIHVSVSPRNKESGYYNKHDSASGTAAQICCMSLIKCMIGLDAKLLFLYFFTTNTYKNASVTNTKLLDIKADTMFFIMLEDDFYFKKFGMRKYNLS